MATLLGTILGQTGRDGKTGDAGPDGPRGWPGHGEGIDYGVATVTTDANGDGTVTFAKPFTTAPVVVADHRIAGDSVSQGYHLGITSTTETGFKIRVIKHGARVMAKYAGQVTISYVTKGTVA